MFGSILLAAAGLLGTYLAIPTDEHPLVSKLLWVPRAATIIAGLLPFTAAGLLVTVRSPDYERFALFVLALLSMMLAFTVAVSWLGPRSAPASP